MQSTRLRPIVLSFAVITAACLIVAWYAHDRATTTPPTVLDPQEPVELAWKEGDQQDYRLEITSHVDVGLLDNDQPLRIEQRLDGTLRLRVTSLTTDEVETACELRAARLVSNGVSDPAVDRQLATPFNADFALDGRLRRLRSTGSLTLSEAAILEEALRCFVLIAPTAADRSWTTTEQCGSGRYEARYEQLADGRISKSKTRFTEGADGTAVDVHESRGIYTLRAGGSWIEACELREMLRVTSRGSVVQSLTTARLQRIEIDEAERAAFDRDSRLGSLNERNDLGSPRPDANAKLIELELDEELRELYTAWLLELDSGTGTDLAAIAALEQLFRSCPEAAALVPETLLSGSHSQRTRGTLLHALERAGTSAAQASLERVATDERHQHGDRIGALVAIGGLQHANGTTIAALWRTAADRSDSTQSDLANTAGLSLGCVGNALRRADPDAYGALRDNLVQALLSSPDAVERSVYLKALGNLADPDLAAQVGAYLTDTDPRVRAAAASSLSTVDGDDNVNALTDALALEDHVRVKRAIALSLDRCTTTTLGTLQLVERLAVEERDEGARDALVRYLGARLEAHPESADTLRQLLQQERSDRIRRYLAERLLEFDSAAPVAH
jgi:HEAT repeat protein